MKNFLGLCLSFTLTNTAGLAHAQSAPTSTPASAPASAPTAPTSVPSSLQSAVDLFNAGEYNKAARLFEAAQGAGVRDPIVWYYLGRCREATNEPSKAIRAYQQYLKLAPSAPDAPAVRLKLADLEANTPADAGSQATSQAADNSEPERPTDDTLAYSPQRKLGYAGIALGSMTMLVGLMLNAVARDRAQFLEDLPPGTPFDETLQEIEREGRAFNKASIITLSTGGAMFLGGLAAALTAPKPQDPSPIVIRISPSASTIGFVYHW